jgi:hypothetical protein
MAAKTVTYMSTLMHYAGMVGAAKRSGDPDRIKAAEAQHDEYKNLMLESDEVKADIPARWANPR